MVANQLERLGGLDPADVADLTAEPVGSAGATGWRTRVRVEVGADGRAGFHRYHSAELVNDLRCAQLPAGMLDDLPVDGVRVGDQLHVVRRRRRDAPRGEQRAEPAHPGTPG